MKKMKIIGLVLLSIIILVALWYLIPTMPKQRPANSVFSVSTSGGMYPVGTSVTLSEEQSELVQMFEGKEIRVLFSVTKEELDNLYARIRKKRFDKIFTYKMKVYDRGGKGVTVSFGDRNTYRAHAGQSFVFPLQRSSFENTFLAIQNLAYQKTEPLKHALTIIVDETLRDGDRENGEIQSFVIDGGGNLQLDSRIFPGDHTIQYSFITKVGEEQFGTYSFRSQGNMELNVFMVGEEIVIE